MAAAAAAAAAPVLALRRRRRGIPECGLELEVLRAGDMDGVRL